MTEFVLVSKTAAFLSTYQLFEDDEIQKIQLQHRLNIVEAFGIEKGMRILEIGCGQGDTTVSLVNAVGNTGKVTAIDIGNREYGAPITFGQATDRIKKSVLGERIDFYFETNIEKKPGTYMIVPCYHIVLGILRTLKICFVILKD